MAHSTAVYLILMSEETLLHAMHGIFNQQDKYRKTKERFSLKVISTNRLLFLFTVQRNAVLQCSIINNNPHYH